MYKYLGFGLLSLVAILMIPAEDVESISDAGMYGMAILTVRDSADNILFTNTVHNLIPDQATAQMLGNMFVDVGTITGDAEGLQADGICLTNASDFGADNTLTSTNFATDGGTGSAFNTLDGAAGNSCKTVTWTMTAQAATGTLTNFAAGGTNVPDGTTITGFAVCDLETVGPDFCDTGSNIVAAIDTSVTLGTGETVDITYVLNLD